MKQIFYTFLLSACSIALCAQGYEPGIRLTDLSVQKNNRQVDIDVQVTIGEKSVENGYKLVLTLQLVHDSLEMNLKPIVVYTRKAEIMDLRNRAVVFDDAIYTQNNSRINYTASIPYESWFEGASIRLDQQLIGCCSETREVLPLESNLQLVYEETKERDESGSAYICFEVGKSQIFVNKTSENLTK